MPVTLNRSKRSAMASGNRGRATKHGTHVMGGIPWENLSCFEIFLIHTLSLGMWGDCDVHDAWILRIL